MIWIYKQHFAQALAKHIDLPLEDLLAMIEIPPENIPGDFAFPCFKLSKLLKKSPLQIAEELKKKLHSDYFSLFEHISGYLNAHIAQSRFIEDSLKLKASNFKPLWSEKVLIEYMNANPNKPLHIGQGRNVCIGDSMRRIYQKLWYTVHAFNYGDDSWVNVGYNIVGHLFYDYPLETDKKFDQYCGKIYEEMRKRDEDPVLKKHLSETLLKIEEGNDEMVNTLHFNYTRRCALDQIRTCRRMNAYFDAVARETDVLHLKFFAEAMDLLRQKWVMKFADDGEAKGCRILDLSSLPEYQKEEKQYQILIKSDGVATYIAKDIAFALWKLGYLSKDFGYEVFEQDPRGETIYTTNAHPDEKVTNHGFGNYDTAITVIDNRQLPAQAIVNSAFKLLHLDKDHKHYLPLGYGVVYLTPATLIKLWYQLTAEERAEKRLPFSSRKWRTVTLDEMFEMLHQKAYRESKERNAEKDDVWLDAVAETIAIGSLRFLLMRSDIDKDLVFDVDEVLDMQGETWTYILYAWARVQSIIDAVGVFEYLDDTTAASLLTAPEEFTLSKKVAEFSDIVIQAKEQLAPYLVCRYLLDIAKLLNSYYAAVHIIKSEEQTKKARIMLLARVRDTMEEAMDLIGMRFLERM